MSRRLLVPLLLSVCMVAAAHGQEAAQLRRLAESLERAGDHAAAVPQYARWLRLAPGDSIAMHGLARSLAAIGRHADLVDLLTPWVRDHPGDMAAAMLLGDGQRGAGDLEAAVRTWRRSLARRPTSPEPYQQVSDRCQQAGLYARAADVLLEARRATGQPHLFGWELAQLYARLGDYARMVDAYLAGLREHPQRYMLVEARLLELVGDETAAGPVLQALEQAIRRARSEPRGDFLQPSILAAFCLLRSGSPERGLEHLLAVADQPEPADLLYQYAARCEERGDAGTAARAYAEFATRRADSPYVYRALLRRASLAAGGDARRAVTLYDSLVQRFPDRPEAQEALYELGRLRLLELDDLPAARAAFETVSRSAGPWADRATLSLAECWLREGKASRADSLLTEVAGRDGGSRYEARYRRAELRFLQGEPAASAALLGPLAADDPSHPLANDAIGLLLLCEELPDSGAVVEHLSRAVWLERRGRPEEAVVDWHWLEEQAPPDIAAWTLRERTRLREQSGDLDGATDLCRRLVARFPQGRQALDARQTEARLLERRGDPAGALRAYEAALLSAPGDARAAQLRLHIDRLRAAARRPDEGRPDEVR